MYTTFILRILQDYSCVISSSLGKLIVDLPPRISSEATRRHKTSLDSSEEVTHFPSVSISVGQIYSDMQEINSLFFLKVTLVQHIEMSTFLI